MSEYTKKEIEIAAKVLEKDLQGLGGSSNKVVSKALDKYNPFANFNFLPLSGGNTIGVELYKTMYDSFSFDSYQWLLIFQRYFTNIFKLKGATLQEQSAFKQYLSCLFWYGSGAIHYDKKTDKYLGYGITPRKIDENLDIEEADCWLNNLSTLGAQYKIKAQIPIRSNIVFGKLNFNALPQIVILYGLLKDITVMSKAFKTNLLFNAKKLIYTKRNNNSETINEEIASILDPSNPVIINIKNEGEELHNLFESVDGKQNENIQLLEQIKSYLGLMQTYLGVYGVHTNIKKERNISNEFAGDEYMVRVQIEETFFELEKFIEKANKEFGKNWSLELFENDQLETEGDIDEEGKDQSEHQVEVKEEKNE